MAEAKKINPLQRDGTSQKMRMPAALDPSFAKIDDKSIKDLLAFAKIYSNELNFFNESNKKDGKWDWFTRYSEGQIIKELETRNDFEPSLGLFLAFLHLMTYVQNDLNSLTEKHLDFYYKNVLQIATNKEVPDKVHVIFELAKNASEQLIKKGSLLDAGKDSKGIKLQYETDDNIIINKAQIASLRNVYIDPSTKRIHFAPVANSADGVGSKLDTSNPKWKIFGGNSFSQVDIGFALASPVLLLKEGIRIITVAIDFTSPFSFASETGAQNNIRIFLSGEDSWLGPFTPAIETATAGRLKFTVQLGKDDKPVVNYDAEKLIDNYITAFPVMRVMVNTDAGFRASDFLKIAVVKSIIIDVHVQGVTELTMENDFGNIDSKKAFMPFGAVPAVGNNWFISYDELMLKHVTHAAFHINWQDVPGNFDSHYAGYSSPPVNSAVAMTLSIKENQKLTGITLFNQDNPANENIIEFDVDDVSNIRLKKINAEITNKLYRQKAIVAMPFNSLKATVEQPVVKRVSRSVNETKKPTTAREFSDIDKGYFRFMLNNSLGHKQFPKILSRALINLQTNKNELIPNEPYTPVIQSASLDYKASASVSYSITSSFDHYVQKQIDFFHAGVFGEVEQHSYLKQTAGPGVDLSMYLLPRYENEGEFYIGLTNAVPLTTVNILFQLAEGSANPGKQKQNIQWSVLCSDEWLVLTSDHILSDSTNGLLTSGIIKFYLPESITTDNTLMPANMAWLRASIESNSDAVCEAINLHAQAIPATLRNNSNAEDHFSDPLAANTITRLTDKLTAVKTTSQPYASFRGAAKESRDAFYIRVSERLRHKARAVSISDYERIVLQQFPSLYKVKCLNHADLSSELSPGNISVIVIPSLKNQSASNRLQPRTDLNTISQIQDYLDEANSFFVRPFVQNPEYEEITLEVEVQFRKNYEFGFYKKVLNEDITRFLSPWAYDSNIDILFGGKIYKTALVNFIDELIYVDFVTNVKLYHTTRTSTQLKDVNIASANNSRSILVSAAQHIITPYDDTNCA